MAEFKGYIACQLQIPATPLGSSSIDQQIMSVKLDCAGPAEPFRVHAFSLTFDKGRFRTSRSWDRPKDPNQRRTGIGYVTVIIRQRLSGGKLIVELPTINRPTRVTVSDADILWDKATRDTHLAHSYVNERLGYQT